MSTVYTGGLAFIVKHDRWQTFLRARLDEDQIAHYLPRQMRGDFSVLGSTLYKVNKAFSTVKSFQDFLENYFLMPSEMLALQCIIRDMAFAEKLLAKGKVANVELRIISEYTEFQERVYNFHHDNNCRIICCYNNPVTEWLDPSEAEVATDNPHIVDEYVAKPDATIYTFPPGTVIRCNKRFVHRAPKNGGYRGVARFVLVVDYPK